MATAAPLRLTKPRLSLLILEATAILVSLVLVLWLLLWFIHRTVQQGGVEAYFVGADGVPPEEVPFQAADVRRFRGAPESDEIRETVLSELPDEILKKVRAGGSTLVVYIAMPVLGQDAGRVSEPIRKLVRDVAREAKRDVVLALDLAQVDTDRELGVFGNSPYSRLADEIRQIVKDQGKPGSGIFILTSSAPAQKSWSAEGLGRSIFAYYLRKGLEGGAKGWDAEEPESLTVAGLHRYVLLNVRRWARLRRDSAQTPQLLAVLPDARQAPDRLPAAHTQGRRGSSRIADAAPGRGEPGPRPVGGEGGGQGESGGRRPGREGTSSAGRVEARRLHRAVGRPLQGMEEARRDEGREAVQRPPGRLEVVRGVAAPGRAWPSRRPARPDPLDPASSRRPGGGP